jgi:phenylalanyl-tRNA synthetase alpha chain
MNLSSELLKIKTLEDCRTFHAKYLSKNGEITKMFMGLKDIEPSKRAARGAELNTLRKETEEKLFAIQRKIEDEELNARLMQEPVIDITNPLIANLERTGHPNASRCLHPITIVSREVEEVFKSMGFVVEDGNEIVTEYECFDSLNCPASHPARDMQDTFWLNDGRCLRTQTSAQQNYMIKKYGPEFRAICPGRTYRNESVDATHDNTFFQLEGMMVGKDISIANLIYFMKKMISEVLRKEINVRLRPGFFPFVEPGFELDSSCPFCEGKGCSVCKQGGWIELCPCGMVHPRVLEMGGLDPNKYHGFAFGLGLTRLTMLRYGLSDIRLFNGGNLEFLKGGVKC